MIHDCEVVCWRGNGVMVHDIKGTAWDNGYVEILASKFDMVK